VTGFAQSGGEVKPSQILITAPEVAYWITHSSGPSPTHHDSCARWWCRWRFSCAVWCSCLRGRPRRWPRTRTARTITESRAQRRRSGMTGLPITTTRRSVVRVVATAKETATARTRTRAGQAPVRARRVL